MAILGRIGDALEQFGKGFIGQPTRPSLPSPATFGADLPPYRSLANRLGGRFGRVLGDIGEVAGTALVPGLMPIIPGTPQHAILENRLREGEAETNLREAQAKEIEARAKSPNPLPGEKPIVVKPGEQIYTPGKGFEQVPGAISPPEEKPSEASGKEAYDSLISSGKTPFDAYKAVYGKTSPELHDAFHEWLADPKDYEEFQKAMEGIKAKGGKNSGFMTMYAMYRLLQTAYQENPALLPAVNTLFKNVMSQQGLPIPPNFDISAIPLDQPVSPETGKPIGTRLPSAPTASTRTQAQVASRVLTELPRITQSISKLGEDLGPIAGRWNEFMTGGVGAGNPQYEQLRTDIEFLNSAAARFHLNSVRSVEKFEKLAQTGKMTPEVLHGYLRAMTDWATTAYRQELGAGEREGGAAKLGGKVVRFEDLPK